MTGTRSCEYIVQPTVDAEKSICGKTGVKRATGRDFDFVYCSMHYETAKKYLDELKYKVEDYDGGR